MRSDSNRPLELSNWYPERDDDGSEYQAVTLVLILTKEPPEGFGTTSAVAW